MSMQQALWHCISEEAAEHAAKEPILASYLHSIILNHTDLASALSYTLASKLDSSTASSLAIREVIDAVYTDEASLVDAAAADIIAFYERDSACAFKSSPLLYYKGYQALQAHRIAHWLWNNKRKEMALFFQGRVSEVFSLDIHPAARIGSGIMIDHGTGIVIGETATVGNNVSILQSVTLGGTGKENGDRHPKIANDVLLGAGSKILGNIHVGEGSQVAAGSVVLNPVPPHTLVSGVPAKAIGKPSCDSPARSMDHRCTASN